MSEASDWVIAVDCDGTIVEHDFPALGPEVPGAFLWLRRWREAGARLILWTMRADGQPAGFNPLAEAVAFCRDRGVEFWGLNINPEQAAWTASAKPYAMLYIDDAAYGCPLIYPGGRRRPYVDWAVVGPNVYLTITGRTWVDPVE